MRINFYFEGAIFDADGTLLDSMHVWRNLGELYLRSRNIVPEEKLSAKLWPLSYEQGCKYLKDNYKLSESVQEIKNGISALIEDFYRNHAELKSGVREFLDELKRKNIHMVIATSGDRELLNAAMTRNGTAEYFDAVFTCSELGTNKRDAKIFLVCAEALGLEPKNIAVFEDALFAIETVKNSGFITFGVYDASSINDREKIICTADYYINDWRNFFNEYSFNNSRQ